MTRYRRGNSVGKSCGVCLRPFADDDEVDHLMREVERLRLLAALNEGAASRVDALTNALNVLWPEHLEAEGYRMRDPELRALLGDEFVEQMDAAHG